ncbi:MAG TPA: adenylate/guanylate cyclase domain-containing protein [Chitinophagaceae bacterium]|nr:adenylate/guanylate cyclase domain-containing protein [Chitinophagaceae bacterium]
MLQSSKSTLSRISPIKKHERKSILLIASFWTLADLTFFVWRKAVGLLPEKYYNPDTNLFKEIFIRELNVFLLSLILGYFLVSQLRNYLRNSSLWFNLFVKTLVLVVAALVMTFFIYITYEWLIAGYSLSFAFNKFIYNLVHKRLLLEKMPEWVVLFFFTLFAIEISEKYSRGVFVNIMLGRYLQPKEERRIIMFLDLKDSTPIAEKLGSKEYFKFIRDFIFYISSGFLQHDGRIYQYVGDEIVVWWPESKENARKAISSLITARKELNKQFDRFKRRYDIVPEYKAGIHTGTVTVGQVGIVKKDLVMSGDSINTAARIRSACTDLNQKFVISKDVADLLGMEGWQVEPLGPVDLKGKNNMMELFALKI